LRSGCAAAEGLHLEYTLMNKRLLGDCWFTVTGAAFEFADFVARGERIEWQLADAPKRAGYSVEGVIDVIRVLATLNEDHSHQSQ